MNKQKRLIVYLLIFCLVFTLCGCGENGVNGDGDELTNSDSVAVSKLVNDTIEMPYDTDCTFNPLTTDSMHNKAVCDLLFESLFTLDADLNPVPVLCTDYETADGVTYTFNLRSDVFFHSGDKFTANDAVYSINEAKNLSLYKYRYSCITSVYALNETSFCVTLSEANYSFPALLTLKIIKNGSMAWLAPSGTGAYYYDNSGASPCLKRFSAYRDDTSAFTDTIGLVDAESIDIRNGFSQGQVDIINMNPLGNSSFLSDSDMDKYFYNTTALTYVGFNYRSFQAGTDAIRKAISLLINRDYIAKNIMDGYMQPTSILLNPSACAYCNVSWESGRTYNEESARKVLESAGIYDQNGDGWLEIPDGTSGYGSTTMNFIVNDDSDEKVEAAQYITDTLRSFGIKVNLSVLSWNAYTEALKSGSFDMYYAEVLVAPDYDFLPVLGVSGAMNYGHIASESFSELIKAMLASPDITSRTEAAKALCNAVGDNCPIAPIGYGKNVLITHRKQLVGISPNAYNLFQHKNSAE